MTTAFINFGGGGGGGGSSTSLATYNSTPPSLSNGQTTPLQVNASGSLNVDETFAAVAEDNTNGVFATAYKPVALGTYSPTITTGSFSTVCSGSIKASQGTLLSAYVVNDTSMAAGERVWLQFHNLTTVPGQGAVPVEVFSVPAPTANTPGVLNLGMDMLTQAGINFSTGIGWSVSAASGSNVAPIDPKLKGIMTRFRAV